MSTGALTLFQFPSFKLFKDARHFQIFYLGSFLLYGFMALGWEADLPGYLTLMSVCMGSQYIFLKIYQKDLSSLKSAMITALGLCLLLKADTLWILALAGLIAISSKFLIRYKGGHLFNPANLGIIASILLTGKAWVSPGQWGSDIVLQN